MKLQTLALVVGIALLLAGCGAITEPLETTEPEFSALASSGTMADFTAPDQFGQIHNLSDYSGKPILVHFCATWCPPCQLFTSHLTEIEAALDAELGNRNYVIVEVLVDADPSHQLSNDSLAAAWAELSGDPSRPVLHMDGGNYPGPFDAWASLSMYVFPVFAVLGPNLEIIHVQPGVPWDMNDEDWIFQVVPWLKNYWAPYLGTAEEKLKLLIADLRAFELPIPNGLLLSLTTKLLIANSSLESGEPEAAVRQLKAFVRQVSGLANSRIPEAEAMALISSARSVIELIEN